MATLVLDDVHITSFVISFMLKSEYTPLAVYCICRPKFREAFLGLISIEFSVAGVVVMFVEPDIPCSAALILVVP